MRESTIAQTRGRYRVMVTFVKRIDQSLQGVDLRLIGRKGECRERRAVTVDHQHDLGSLAFFVLANVGAPFFAGENVPSPIASSQSIWLSASSFFSNRRHAFSQTPAAVHSCNRRQQVAGLGYRSGKSCHRAPVFSTQRMPSRHALAATLGRPPRFDFGGSRSKSRIRSHCELSRNGFGAVLDPVVFGRRRGGHSDRGLSM